MAIQKKFVPAYLSINGESVKIEDVSLESLEITREEYYCECPECSHEFLGLHEETVCPECGKGVAEAKQIDIGGW